MTTYYMQGHESQVNRLRNSYFNKNSKVKPTLSCEYYWDGYITGGIMYMGHGPPVKMKFRAFYNLRTSLIFRPVPLGYHLRPQPSNQRGPEGAGLPVLHIWTKSLLLQIGHSSPFSTTVHTIGLIYGAILHILGALIMRKYTLDHRKYLIQNGGECFE